jgi:RNA-directed DNA polymerase
LLGIATVGDRWLQQCVLQVMAPQFEYEFKEHSYGFRPNKNALQCVQQSQQYINDGYQHIVDIDLKSFFDEVNHCMLLELLYRKVKCPLTLRLIRKWLTAPMLVNGRLIKGRKGVPQGSPLSPVMSNIMLHELDKELEKQGCRYVRYADDSAPGMLFYGGREQCFIKDGGWPAGTGLQELVSNHRKLHWLRAFVVSVTEKAV